MKLLDRLHEEDASCLLSLLQQIEARKALIKKYGEALSYNSGERSWQYDPQQERFWIAVARREGSDAHPKNFAETLNELLGDKSLFTQISGGFVDRVEIKLDDIPAFVEASNKNGFEVIQLFENNEENIEEYTRPRRPSSGFTRY